MIEQFIEDLTKEQAETLDSYISLKEAPRGTVLLEEGSESRDIHFIYDGGIDVYQRIEHSGQVMALRVVRMHETPVMLGESNMFLGQKRSASVVATYDVKYGILSYDDIMRLKNEHLELYIRLIEYCGELMASRVIGGQETLQARVIQNTDTPGKAFALLRIINESVKVCQPALAKKLFGAARFFSDY